MELHEAIGWMVGGLVILILGGEWLVRGAARLAAVAKISPLMIGLTVVAFGTSAPELAVTVQSCWAGNTELAVGNVVGSSIFNVLFVLGLSSLIVPLTVAARLVRFDVPWMILASAALFLLSLDGEITRMDGLILLAGLLAYGFRMIRQGRCEKKEVQQEYETHGEAPPRPGKLHVLKQIGLVLVGAIALTIGARFLVDGAVSLATRMGISELVIGLTIISIGTSLPEIVTSVMASIRGQRDIAVGNVVGSNILNILAVLGISASVSPEVIQVSPEALYFDIPVMLAVTFACLPIFFTGHLIARWEGALFLFYCVAYFVCLYLRATTDTLNGTFTTILWMFVLPMTTVAIGISVVRSVRDAQPPVLPPPGCS